MAFRYTGGVVGVEREGKGKYLYPGGSFSYEGDWVRGVKHGHGEFRVPDGSMYRGSFVNGEIQGQGERVWPNGSRYKGQFFAGERNGHGSFYDADTMEIYDGEWCNNVRTGAGSLVFPDGSKYIGAFVRNVRNGDGKFSTADGMEYSGGFASNLFHGEGLLAYPTGSVYEGAFVKGRRQGQGRYQCGLTGISYQGEWHGDGPVERARAIMIESPGIVQLSTELQQAAALAATAYSKGKPKKEDPASKKGKPPDSSANPAPAALQVRVGTALPPIFIKAVLQEAQATANNPPGTPASIARCESGRRLLLTLVKMEGEAKSAPIPWFKRLPTIGKESESRARFPTRGCCALFVHDKDVISLAPSKTDDHTNKGPGTQADFSSSLSLRGGAQIGERAGNPCITLVPSSTATTSTMPGMSSSSVDWAAGVSLTCDFFVDAKAVIDKAAAGPLDPDGKTPTMELLTVSSSSNSSSMPSSSAPSTSVHVLLTAMLKEPDEDRQSPEASLAIRVGDDESAPVVELVKDVPLDAWHAMVLTVRGTAVSLCLNGISFETSLPVQPTAFNHGSEWRLGGDGYGGGAKNLGMYLDGALELAEALEVSSCYRRVQDQEWRAVEEDARRRQAWEEGGSEGPAPETLAGAALVTSVEVLTSRGEVTAEGLVLPSQLVPGGQYAIYVEDKTIQALSRKAEVTKAADETKTGGDDDQGTAFLPLPPAALVFVVAQQAE